jgi:hypothetical protein
VYSCILQVYTHLLKYVVLDVANTIASRTVVKFAVHITAVAVLATIGAVIPVDVKCCCMCCVQSCSCIKCCKNLKNLLKLF